MTTPENSPTADACDAKDRENPLRIVRAREDDAGLEADLDLDLDLDDAETDRRYGREDIADK